MIRKVNSCFGWMGFKDTTGDTDARPVLDLVCFDLKHFRLPQEVMRIMPSVFSDDELRALRIPVLLLIGDREVIYDPVKALARPQALLQNFEGELVPRCKHDMCFSQHRIVDARVLDFLKEVESQGS